jgi:hypothetical protein
MVIKSVASHKTVFLDLQTGQTPQLLSLMLAITTVDFNRGDSLLGYCAM